MEVAKVLCYGFLDIIMLKNRYLKTHLPLWEPLLFFFFFVLPFSVFQGKLWWHFLVDLCVKINFSSKITKVHCFNKSFNWLYLLDSNLKFKFNFTLCTLTNKTIMEVAKVLCYDFLDIMLKNGYLKTHLPLWEPLLYLFFFLFCFPKYVILTFSHWLKGCHIFGMHDPSFLGLEESYHNKNFKEL